MHNNKTRWSRGDGGGCGIGGEGGGCGLLGLGGGGGNGCGGGEEVLVEWRWIWGCRFEVTLSFPS